MTEGTHANQSIAAPEIPGSVYMVGLMGSGKTSVGKVLARLMGKTFFDADYEIERATGVRIPVIFEIEGEAGFRARERKMIADLTQRDNILLATGGGAVLAPENRAALKARGTVIYLRAPVRALLRRTQRDRNRPLLQVDDPAAKLRELYDQRDPLYREVADLVVDTGNQSVRALAAQIINQLAAHHAAGNTTVGTLTMRTLSVDLGEHRYPIHIGAGLLDHTKLIPASLLKGKAVIITNETIAPLYLARTVAAVEAAGAQSLVITLPDGEAHKSWASLNRIFDELLVNRCERKTPLIALGGGVIGDLTGFAAATYQRGVPFIQLPTTLLAQVDSSVGGKTAINHPLGKNMIGAFYQPRVVIADMDTLRTLPPRELAAGIAEVVKYGFIRDPEFLDWLEHNVERLSALEPEALAFAVERSCQNKAAVVANDERETGERALLNFGHTFGHAIEAGMGYGQWLHGEAVGAGMVMAARFSERLGYIGKTDVQRVVDILARAKLPLQAPALGVERYLDLMGHDKKVEGGKIKFILLKTPGEAFICDQYDTAALHAVLSTPEQTHA